MSPNEAIEFTIEWLYMQIKIADEESRESMLKLIDHLNAIDLD